MKRCLLYLFLLLSSNAFAQKTEIDAAKTAIESAKYWLDMDYVGDGIVGHRLDIHLPKKGVAPFPIVVAIYGSAWFSNSSKGNTFKTGLGQTLLSNGFAVVSINHRSSSDAVFPAQIQDVKAAIRFIRANSEKFSLDTTFIGITGWSSGGHLAALTGTTNEVKTKQLNGIAIDIEGNLGQYTEISSQVDAVVDWFGPTDFLIMDTCGSSFSHNEVTSPESSLIGGAIQDNPDECALVNPITYVQKNNPPFLIFHGDQDPLVPNCQSELLFEKLQKKGVKSELVLIKDGKHGPGVMTSEHYEQMIAFFKNHRRPTRYHPPEIPTASKVETYKKVGDTELKAWIFNPPKHQAMDKKPAIVFFFGGGWNGGTAEQFIKHSEYLAARGMVAIVVDYRVFKRQGVKPYQCVADAKSAIRWMRQNADSLGVDSKRIVAAGGSAGGHLAASTATLPDYDESTEDLSISSVPNAMALFNPVLVTADIPDKFELSTARKKGLFRRLGAEPTTLSPFHHIQAGIGPCIIFHGTADTTVPFRTAELFHQVATAKGIDCTLVAYNGEGHGFFNYGRKKNQPFVDTVAKLDDFLVRIGYLEGISGIRVY